MAIVTSLLKAEIQSDPNALGYGPLATAKNWGGIAEILNDPVKGAVTTVTYQSAATLQGAVVPAEYITLTQPQRDMWQAIITASGGSVDVNGTGIKSQIAAIYTNGTAPLTRAAMIALQTRQASRGEILFGIGTQVTFYDVYYAAGP